MNPEKDKEFDQNLNQLIGLLKKLIKGLPSQQGPFTPNASNAKDGNINLNFCFFTFLPMAPEDFDEIEEAYDQFFFNEDKQQEDFSLDLNPSDLDFLRRNGIRY
jgi:hypothetical protein